MVRMKEFCGSEIWDTTLLWESPSPDFTPCFEKSILISVPCLYLWVFGPLEGLRLKNSKNSFIPWTWKNASKTIISAIIIAAEISLLISNIALRNDEENFLYGVDYFYPSILLVTVVLQLLFVILEKRRGLQSSGYLFGFWLLMMIFALPGYRTNFLYMQDETKENPNGINTSGMVEFVIYMIFYPSTVVMFLLNCFADDKPQKEFYPRGTNFSPKLNASFLSEITFSWLDRLIWKGFRNPLKQEDLCDLPPENSSKVVIKHFEKHWDNVQKKFQRRKMNEKNEKKKISIFPALFNTFRYEILIGVFLKLIPDVLIFVSPLLVSLLIGFAEDLSIVEWKGYFYAIMLLIVTEVQSILNAQQFVVMTVTGLKIRTAVTSAIYKKALRISSSAKKESTVGEIVNLMAVDIQRFMDMMGYVNAMWSAPLQIILCIFFLWRILGPSAMVGLLIMIIFIPLNGWIASKQKGFQITQMKEKDKRVKIMNEILNGIKVLKLYAWEPAFISQVKDIRKTEVNVLKKSSYLGAGTSFLFTCTPFMVSFFMFMTYVLISPDHVLSPDIVFVSISLLNILRMPMILLPMIIVTVVQAGVSLKRMNKFINAEELNPEAVERDTSEGDPVVIENGNFSWGHEEEDKPVLKAINLRIPEGSLVGVVGTVGAGKSSLCSAILGEMEKNSGRVNVSKSVAFVPQQAWIQNATLKSNILFSKKDSSSFYQKVIKACALKPDLEVLPDGDRTEIGEKVYTKFKMFIMNINEDIQNLGINLSGGQKQRVSLARAVYSNAEIYLLDDPLSAVDAHVGKHIFEHVIGSSGILRNKTRVLVTHGLSHLREMDEIIVLKNGEIAERGSFSYLISKEGDFQEFLLQYLTQKEREEEELEPEVLEEIKSELEKSMGGKSMQRQISELSRASDTKEERSGSRSGRDSIRRRRGSDISRSSIKAQRDLKGTSDKGKIIKEETAGIGRMSSKVYIYYAKSIGMLAAILTILFYATSQAFAVLGNILLSEWSDNPNGSAPKTRNSYLYVYASFGIGQALSVLLGYTILARAAINGSKYLHNAMLDNVVHSPMSFYDMTPIGRIVNRFSKDTDIIDILLPMNLRSFLICLMSVIATYIAVIYATPMFAVVIVPALILYSIIQNVYIKTSRQLKRIESVTRSPIYTHFGESVQGAITIRAYHREEEFILQSREKVDYNQLSYYPNLVSYRWLAVRLELIGNILTFFAALFTVINRKSISGGDVGLSISYALSVTQVLNYLVRLTSEVETSMVSVERIKEYTEIPQEAAWDIPSNKPPKSWPENGVVEFKDYSTRYRSGLDLVIKNISCLINSTEKLGIVGRTGAGKSSLTVALFRIIEPANGTVLIDGVDISKIGLHDLRARLTIIPQDPVLFSGTLRMNLDPLNRHSDDSIWNAFEHSHLKEFVSSLPSKLNYGIAEGGENLSVGQRQLVCLARALLRKTKVLILDEATAAVDLETDDLIQETIRREFADCTVITIAHRLNTIMDSTRIIVLDRGEVKEFDTPSNLLQNPSSLFYDMSKSAGLI